MAIILHLFELEDLLLIHSQRTRIVVHWFRGELYRAHILDLCEATIADACSRGCPGIHLIVRLSRISHDIRYCLLAAVVGELAVVGKQAG